jgi:hypothetical protein
MPLSNNKKRDIDVVLLANFYETTRPSIPGDIFILVAARI